MDFASTRRSGGVKDMSRSEVKRHAETSETIDGLTPIARGTDEYCYARTSPLRHSRRYACYESPTSKIAGYSPYRSTSGVEHYKDLDDRFGSYRYNPSPRSRGPADYYYTATPQRSQARAHHRHSFRYYNEDDKYNSSATPSYSPRYTYFASPPPPYRAQTRVPRPAFQHKASPTTRKTTESDAKRYGIPKGYPLKNWDPAEEPILLLGSVFDANSLGKWIYDWTVNSRGVSAPVSDLAGELWLLLIQLAGKTKHDRKQTIPSTGNPANKKIVEGFMDGERIPSLNEDVDHHDHRALRNEQHEPSFRAAKSSQHCIGKIRIDIPSLLDMLLPEVALQAGRTRKGLIDTILSAVVEFSRSAFLPVGQKLAKNVCRFLGRSSGRAKPLALLVMIGLIQPALAMPDFKQPLVIVPGVMAWASTLFSYLVNSQNAGDTWIQIGFCVLAGAIVALFFFLIVSRIFNDPIARQSSTKLVSFFGGALFILRQTASDISGLQLVNHAILSVLIALTGEIFCIARLVETPQVDDTSDEGSFMETAADMEDGRASGIEATSGPSSRGL